MRARSEKEKTMPSAMLQRAATAVLAAAAFLFLGGRTVSCRLDIAFD